MVLQHSRSLLEPIRKVGCEYLTCLAAAEHFMVDSFSVDDINDIWEKAKVNGAIDDKDELAFPDSYRKLFAVAAQHSKGIDIFGDQIGAIEKGVIEFWSWYHASRFNYFFRRFVCRARIPHTILLDFNFNTIYDSAPWVAGREIVGDYLYYLSTRKNFDRIARG